jgi:polygalacturonase
MMRSSVKKCLLFLIALSPTKTFAQIYNITDYGAIRDGKTINTKAIQRAIDRCAQAGGTVVIPKGVYVSGTLYLKSKVHIQIDSGGVLKGSPSFADYPFNQVRYDNAFTYSNGKSNANHAFLFAEDVHDISISGEGKIDGSGDSPEFNLGNDDNAPSRLRPCLILLVKCKNIGLTDITLTNSAYWMQNYLGCEFLHLKGLTIFDQSNYNQDGMDIDAKHVLIEDCKIDVDDDGICLKSHDQDFIVEDVIVRNCSISSNCNAIKFGTMSRGGFKNIDISHCTIQKASEDHIRHWQKNLQFIDQPITVISGIALECVDGGAIDHVNISDISMSDVQTPVFIVLGNRGIKKAAGSGFYNTASADQPNPGGTGKISNIKLKNIKATSHSKMSSSITAYPGHYVENVTLSNLVFNNMGTGTMADSEVQLPENSKAYPENRMYGQVYPASALFIRHVKGITADHITMNFRNTDLRPVIVMDDVIGAKLLKLRTVAPLGASPVLQLAGSKAITIVASDVMPADHPLLQLKATDTKEVTIKHR